MSENTESETSETYTVTLNGEQYELNEDARARIQERARNEYAENESFSCWWKVASEADANDEDTVHEKGDPILVIETLGPIVPWERLDQLEVEEQTTDAFGEFDAGSNEGSDDDSQEKERTHFGVSPQDFEEVPSPDGEDSDKIPAKPAEFDEPSMVIFVPDNPNVEHTWAAGEAMTAMHNWVEWNVQAKANQPRPEKDDGHDHWETLLKLDDCEHLGEAEESDSDKDDDILDKVDEGGDSDEDVADHYKDGKYGGGNWTV